LTRSGNSVDRLVVHFVLTYHWFDEMTAGRKDTEFRAMTTHWRRLVWDRRCQITHAVFSRGYTATRITRPVSCVDIGPCPYDGWAGNYYRIHLGPVMHNTESEPRGLSA